jgi:hypothetical protein
MYTVNAILLVQGKNCPPKFKKCDATVFKFATNFFPQYFLMEVRNVYY